MNAQLEPIASRPIQAPVYLNDRIRNFQLWYLDNLNELSRYFSDLQPYAPEGTEPARDFFEFAAIQHEMTDAALTLSQEPAGGFLRKLFQTKLPHGESL